MTAPEPNVSLTDAHQWALDAAIVEESSTTPVETLLAFRIRRLATTLDNFMLTLQEQKRGYQRDLHSAADQVKDATDRVEAIADQVKVITTRAEKAEALLRRVIPHHHGTPRALAREIEDALEDTPLPKGGK